MLQEYYKNEYHQKLKQPIHEFKKELKDKNWLDQQSKEHEFFLNKFGKSKGNILDVGCGNGLFLNYMKTKGWNVLGIEPSIHARKNAATFEVETQANFNGLKNSTFDVIMLRYTLEHLRNPSLMLKNIL